MPSVFSHPAVPMAIFTAAGNRRVPVRLFMAALLFSVIPDLDVISFNFGIPYEHLLGHRGFFHSPVFAVLASLAGALAYRFLRSSYWTAFSVLLVSMASNGILDAATDGGKGIAFLAPFSAKRFFLPWQPIAVSPIGVERFFTDRGLMVMKSEIVWVWLPLVTLGLSGLLIRHVWLLRSAFSPADCVEIGD